MVNDVLISCLLFSGLQKLREDLFSVYLFNLSQLPVHSCFIPYIVRHFILIQLWDSIPKSIISAVVLSQSRGLTSCLVSIFPDFPLVLLFWQVQEFAMEKLQLLKKVTTQSCMTSCYLKTSCGTHTSISSEAWGFSHLCDTMTLYVLSQLSSATGKRNCKMPIWWSILAIH